MINNVYELEDGKQYVVLIEETIDNRKYVLVAECNYEKDEFNEDSLQLKEVGTSDNSLVFKNPEDDIAVKILLTMISKKYNENK